MSDGEEEDRTTSLQTAVEVCRVGPSIGGLTQRGRRQFSSLTLFGGHHTQLAVLVSREIGKSMYVRIPYSHARHIILRGRR